MAAPILGTPAPQFVDTNGNPLVGGLLYTYQTGTATPQSSYPTAADADAATNANSNPVVLDSNGYANGLWAPDDTVYTVVIKNSAGVTQWTADGISVDTAAGLRADLADTDTVGNGDALVGGKRTLASAVAFTLHKYHENRIINAKVDFGATGDGVTDDTTAINDAVTAAAGGTVYLPAGTYLVSNLDVFDAAGTRLIGESKYTTILKVKSGTTGSILRNSAAASGTSAYCAVKSLRINLDSIDVVGIDLSSVNNSKVEDVFITGGTSLGTATGTGIKFGAPLSSGAYSNSAVDCTVHFCGEGVQWGEGANQNSVFGGEVVSCTIGLDANPGGTQVDTPKVFGTRIETCGTGVSEGAIYGFYCGLRFENNTIDIDFAADSDHPQFFGGYTATSPTVLNNISNADSPVILSSDLGWYEIEASASRSKRLQGKHVFSAAGAAIPTAPSGTYAAYFDGEAWLKNNIWIRSMNAAGDGQVLAVSVDSSNRLNLRSLNSVGSVDADVRIGGGGAVVPIADSTTSLGKAGVLWTEVFADNATINTSDARKKEVRGPLSDAELRVAKRIAQGMVVYRMQAAIAKKGDGARLHVGVLAQEVINHFLTEGLDPFAYSMVCADLLTETVEEEVEGPDGQMVVVGREVPRIDPETGQQAVGYGVRYEQLLCFVCAAQEQRLAALES